MANVRNGNTIFIDSTGDLTITATRVYYVTITATAANASITLQDSGANVNKITVSTPTDDDTRILDFSTRPMFFPGGVSVSAIANCVATLITEVQGAG